MKGVEDFACTPVGGWEENRIRGLHRSAWPLPWRGHICTLGLRQGFQPSRDHSEAGYIQQAAVLSSTAKAGGGHQLLFPRGFSRHLLPCWLHPTGPHPCFCLRRSTDSTSHTPLPKTLPTHNNCQDLHCLRDHWSPLLHLCGVKLFSMSVCTLQEKKPRHVTYSLLLH